MATTTLVVEPPKTVKLSNSSAADTGAVESATWEIIQNGVVVATYTHTGEQVTSLDDGRCIAYHVFTEADGGKRFWAKLTATKSNGWTATATYKIDVQNTPES